MSWGSCPLSPASLFLFPASLDACHAQAFSAPPRVSCLLPRSAECPGLGAGGVALTQGRGAGVAPSPVAEPHRHSHWRAGESSPHPPSCTASGTATRGLHVGTDLPIVPRRQGRGVPWSQGCEGRTRCVGKALGQHCRWERVASPMARSPGTAVAPYQGQLWESLAQPGSARSVTTGSCDMQTLPL